MQHNSDIQLSKLRTFFEKKQASNAIALAAKLLQKPLATADVHAILSICSDYQKYDFVLHALQKKLVTSTDILLDLDLVADTLSRGLVQDPHARSANLAWLAKYLAGIVRHVNNVPGLIYNLATRMGYVRSSSRATVSVLLTHFIVPIIKSLLAQAAYSNALIIEQFAYDIYVKQAESEKSFAEFMTLVHADMSAAGTKLRQTTATPTLPCPPASVSEPYSEPYRVAFIVHNASMLAHISAMLSFFAGLNDIGNIRLIPIVFVFSQHDAAMQAQCQRLGVKVISLAEEEHDLCQQIILLKTKIAAEACTTVVWLCLSNWMCFCFAYRLAPVQIWWSMKYHNFTSSDIDGYLCRFPVGTDFFNGKWKGGFLCADSLFDASKQQAAVAIRQQYADKLILGTLGRAELLNDSRFLGAVIEILHRNPSTIYLWTGREQEPAIYQAFAEAKLLDRTVFIGWVDTKLYAQVFDIYLDVFSFGTGFTLVEAMAAHKPVVFLEEQRDFSVLKVLRGVIDNAYVILTPAQQTLLDVLVAKSPEQYIANANNLISSSQLRQQAGSLMAELAAIFANKALSATIYAQHITSIIHDLTQGTSDAEARSIASSSAESTNL
jgi:hypothetical protein